MIPIKYALVSFAAVAAGLLASTPVVASPHVGITINNGTSLALWSDGIFNYDGTSLLVQTDGPLFCANIAESEAPLRSIIPQYHNSAWQLPEATDVRSLSYGAGGTLLKINQGISNSSLVCHPINGAGHPASPFSDGLFYQNFDDRNFNDSLPPKPAEAVDVYTAGTAPCGSPIPSATCMRMAAYQDGAHQMLGYTFEFGASVTGDLQGMTVPVSVRDAYHGHFLGANPDDPTDFGDYCISSTPFSDPAAPCPLEMSGNVLVTGPLSGQEFLDIPFSLNEPTMTVVRYVMVHRYVAPAGLPVNYGAPIVGVAIFAGPLDGSGGSDWFVGDDVTFGCYPTGVCGQRSGGRN